MPLPAVAIGAIVGGSFLAELAADFVKELIDDVKGNTIRGAVDYGKVELFASTLKQWTAEFLQSMLAKPHTVAGVDPSGLLDIFLEAIRATAKVSMVLSAEVAEELFMELIQEGFSNAVQFTIGGAIQNILAFWRGSYGVQTGQTYQVMNIIDQIDDLTLTWMLLSSGEHLITLVYETIYGLMQKYDDDKQLQMSQIVSTVEYLNRLAFSRNEVLKAEADRVLGRALRTMEEYYDRLVALADSLFERLVSRLNELDAEVESHWRLWNAGAISDETMVAVLVENSELVDAAMQSYTSIITTLLNEVNNAAASTAIYADLSAYSNLIQLLSVEYKKLIDVIAYNDYTTRIMDILDRVNAIRTYDIPTGQAQPSPVNLQPPPAGPPPITIYDPTSLHEVRG